VTDPFSEIEDPGLTPAFQDFIDNLNETQREAMIKARVGQGHFREEVIKRWGGCSVTACGAHDLLIASHIRPWSKCTTPAERLSAANGLLLTPNLDKLFDRGLITFDEKFRICISPKLRLSDALHLNVNRNLRLTSKADQDMLPYLDYHMRYVFKST
jgi:predicted restriction endonuclease